MRLHSWVILLAAAAVTGAPSPDATSPEVLATLVTDACAIIRPALGSKVEGDIHFEKTGDAVSITGRISGLAPGRHGFHIHMYGNCSAPDAASAGDHFNPARHDHGGPKDQNRHAGDLGNIEVGADGIVNVSLSDTVISLSGPNSILGRSLVIHQNADDLKSQPSGESGPRLACGVIGVAPPK